jgi:hypothetical protein
MAWGKRGRGDERRKYEDGVDGEVGGSVSYIVMPLLGLG